MRDHAKGGALTEVTFYILLALCAPRHGYAVMQFIEEKTAGRLSLGAGTLYGALNALLDKGWIAPCGEQAGRQKTYCITARGREAAGRDLERLRELTAAAAEILEGGEKNEALPVFRRAAEGPGELAEQNGGPGAAAGGYREVLV